MLKYKIAKLEEAPEGAAQFYKADGDGFVLNVTGEPGSDELRRAKDHEKNLRVAAENNLATAQAALEAANANLTTVTSERDAAVAAKGQDVATLEASWRTKVEAAETAKANAEKELGGEISRLLVTTEAERIAAEISIIPEMFAESVVSKRLVAEKGSDGKYFTRVLDAEGKPSAATLDELKKELLANDKYATIIVAGKGSGSGASKAPTGGGAAKKYADYSDAELSELRRTNETEYKRVMAEANAALGAS